MALDGFASTKGWRWTRDSTFNQDEFRRITISPIFGLDLHFLIQHFSDQVKKCFQQNRIFCLFTFLKQPEIQSKIYCNIILMMKFTVLPRIRMEWNVSMCDRLLIKQKNILRLQNIVTNMAQIKLHNCLHFAASEIHGTGQYLTISLRTEAKLNGIEMISLNL